MKLTGVARFDCVGSTQEFTCYVAGFASRGDHTCGWTTSTLHSHLAWQYWFRWGCGGSSGKSPVAESSRVCTYRRPPARNAHRTLASQQQDTGESPSSAPPSQPIRSRQAPVTSRCTRSEGVQCLQIGCTTSSTSSLRTGCLARATHAGVRQAQAVQRCTRYSSNALDRRALH